MVYAITTAAVVLSMVGIGESLRRRVLGHNLERALRRVPVEQDRRRRPGRG